MKKTINSFYWVAGFQKGGAAAGEAAFDLITNFSRMTVPKELVEQYFPGSPVYNNLWEEITKTAYRFNESGRFTALIGFV